MPKSYWEYHEETKVDGTKEQGWRLRTYKTSSERTSDAALGIIGAVIIGGIIAILIIVQEIIEAIIGAALWFNDKVITPTVDWTSNTYNAVSQWVSGAYAFVASHIGMWLRYAALVLGLAGLITLLVFLAFTIIKKAKRNRKETQNNAEQITEQETIAETPETCEPDSPIQEEFTVNEETSDKKMVKPELLKKKKPKRHIKTPDEIWAEESSREGFTLVSSEKVNKEKAE